MFSPNKDINKLVIHTLKLHRINLYFSPLFIKKQ